MSVSNAQFNPKPARHSAIALLTTLAFFVCACVSSGEDDFEAGSPSVLEDLDAHDVVEAYFSIGNSDVEYYLSSPQQQELLRGPGIVPKEERVGGVDNLEIEPLGERVEVEDGSENQLFFVSYTTRNENNIGMPPGDRRFFVHVDGSRESHRGESTGLVLAHNLEPRTWRCRDRSEATLAATFFCCRLSNSGLLRPNSHSMLQSARGTQRRPDRRRLVSKTSVFEAVSWSAT